MHLLHVRFLDKMSADSILLVQNLLLQWRHLALLSPLDVTGREEFVSRCLLVNLVNWGYIECIYVLVKGLVRLLSRGSLAHLRLV